MSRVAVLGASGRVGRRIVARLLDSGHDVTAQTRSAEKLAEFRDRAKILAFDPTDAGKHDAFLRDADAAVFALGNRALGPTTFFSDVTRALLSSMASAGIRRLVAITGVGAGETRGHGGFVYNYIVFPLLTARVYADKERQEKMIAKSGLDWTIVRPAPFSDRAPGTPLEVVTEVPQELQLSAITVDEVADFVAGEIETPRHIHERPFIGHA